MAGFTTQTIPQSFRRSIPVSYTHLVRAFHGDKAANQTLNRTIEETEQQNFKLERKRIPYNAVSYTHLVQGAIDGEGIGRRIVAVEIGSQQKQAVHLVRVLRSELGGHGPAHGAVSYTHLDYLRILFGDVQDDETNE